MSSLVSVQVRRTLIAHIQLPKLTNVFKQVKHNGMSDDTTKQRDELILPLNVDVEIVKKIS